MNLSMLTILLISLLASATAKKAKGRDSNVDVVITTFPDKNDIDFYKTSVPPLPKLENILGSIPPEKILNKKKMKASNQKVDIEASKSKSQKNFELVEADDDSEIIIEADDVYPVPEAKLADSSCSSCCKEEIKMQLASEKPSKSHPTAGKVHSIERPDLKTNSSTSNRVLKYYASIAVLIVAIVTFLY